MQVILLENMGKLGSIGDKVRVKPGYGRNYLLPLGKAAIANAENMRQFEDRRGELEKQASDRLQQAKSRSEKIEKLSLTMKVRVSDEGKLFGSITPRDIAQAIVAEGYEVSKSEVDMPEGPIRHIGEYDIHIILHSEVMVDLKISVIAE